MADLVAIAYQDVATAQEVASNVVQLQKSHEIELEDMAVVERRDDGKIKPHRLGSKLEPGAAALLVLVDKVSPDKILPQIKIPGTVIQTSLDNETERQLSDALAAAGR